jgi:hypothetical protein
MSAFEKLNIYMKNKKVHSSKNDNKLYAGDFKNE